ncbi:GNAT family N-acetyltransferase [Rhizobium ruizarguesonis]|uniref:GNAT family N-acetyltransferase n=1 Tax=Rhizobium ruizarguesonis TaxID=2081791 RepID=UPI0010317BFA|nr:GNAT family N-acetyltransferase [Rhizobium ruizarguesonis]TBD37835.1 GNAT family N-acetyltransferase [Rhizobium ruizarguesonis]TBD42544.1 GNAT family N-acetyltransferase [Rhizobium ruizarguesonis]TBD58890.1 GNAT family N-acetyltransferase [Rhizobium ruizarguesonis]TBD85176.1 GNAT family N-acetyltransferase [Rhizobium ruizarguesonis]TBD90040.1 GNAT family N-acetyltransferase [Rhizobium ruizarguesonis]
MKHILDRPIWSALETAHADLAEGGKSARRYPVSIVPFAASADDTPESLDALENLPSQAESMILVESGPIAIPPGLAIVTEASLVQMVAERPHERLSDTRIQPLTEADAADMLVLATLTKPGPFTLRAQSLGSFWGIKSEGRLVAMAGQRMRQTGFIELSGLCTHPDFQGRGLGTLLFRFVAGEIASSGDTAYLHAYAANTSAISLYKTHGFALRSEMNMRVVKRRS